MSDKPTYGIITESYHYAIDGEFCSGYKEHNVKVTEYYKTGELKDYPKEVKTAINRYYKFTKKYGWREFYKNEPNPAHRYKNNTYTGTTMSFIPNVNTDYSKEYNRVNLGSW